MDEKPALNDSFYDDNDDGEGEGSAPLKETIVSCTDQKPALNDSFYDDDDGEGEGRAPLQETVVSSIDQKPALNDSFYDDDDEDSETVVPSIDQKPALNDSFYDDDDDGEDGAPLQETVVSSTDQKPALNDSFYEDDGEQTGEESKANMRGGTPSTTRGQKRAHRDDSFYDDDDADGGDEGKDEAQVDGQALLERTLGKLAVKHSKTPASMPKPGQDVGSATLRNKPLRQRSSATEEVDFVPSTRVFKKDG